MKRLLTVWFISLLLVGAIALGLPRVSLATPLSQTDTPPNSFVEKLKTDVLPQLEDLLSPEQIAAFDQALETGNLRKAFDAADLTMEQKDQVSALVKSLPKGSLSALAADKQEFFLSQKEGAFDKEQFMPDFKAIQEKKKAFMPDFEAIQAKKKAFMPDFEAIQAKKKAFMPDIDIDSEASGEEKGSFMPDFKSFMPDFKAIGEKKKAFMPDLSKIIEERQAAKAAAEAAEAAGVTE